MRSFTRTQIVLTSLGTAAVVVVAGRQIVQNKHQPLVTAKAPQATEGSKPVASSTTPTAPLAVAGGSCALPDGTALGYRLTATTIVQMNNGQPSPPDSTAGLTLDVKALTTDAEGTVLLAKLHEVDAAVTQTRGDLSQPFLLRLDGKCHLAGFARLATAKLADARDEEGVAYGLQFTWPKDDKGATTAEAIANGENAFGAYRATFTTDVSQPARILEGRIDAYTRTWEDDALPTDGAQKERRPVGSHLRIEIGSSPWFQSLSSTERLTILSASVENKLSVQAQPATDHVFDGVPTDVTKYIWEDLLPKRMAAPLSKARSPQEKAEVAAAARLTLPQAIRKFENGVAANASMLDVAKPLASFFEAHPESAKVVAQEIKTGQIPQDRDAAVFVALGLTPNTQARDALMSMKNDTSRPAFDRARSVFALVDRSDVGVDFAKDLRSDAQAITSGGTRDARLYARHAALAVGMMAGLHGAEHPEITEAAKGTVTDILSSQPRTNVLALKPAFETAANIGDASMLDAFVPYLRDNDPAMRREAFIVIRRMPPASTTTLATALLAGETDWGVKAKAYHVLWLQHHDAQATPALPLIQQTLADLATNPATLTRQSMIQLLGPAAATVPQARAGLLAWAPREFAMRKEGLYDLLATYLTGPELTAALAGAKK